MFAFRTQPNGCGVNRDTAHTPRWSRPQFHNGAPVPCSTGFSCDAGKCKVANGFPCKVPTDCAAGTTCNATKICTPSVGPVTTCIAPTNECDSSSPCCNAKQQCLPLPNGKRYCYLAPGQPCASAQDACLPGYHCGYGPNMNDPRKYCVNQVYH